MVGPSNIVLPTISQMKKKQTVSSNMSGLNNDAKRQYDLRVYELTSRSTSFVHKMADHYFVLLNNVFDELDKLE